MIGIPNKLIYWVPNKLIGLSRFLDSIIKIEFILLSVRFTMYGVLVRSVPHL